ncbi:hypothetical protein C8J56DRAFT_900687 [Mycena floridula]|nr:hypothetical protein C8J56DRAFT_900687 [Mycena floridula]
MASSNQWSNWNSAPDIPYSPMIPDNLGLLPAGPTNDSRHSPMDLDVPGPSSLLFLPVNPSQQSDSLFPDSNNAPTQELPLKYDAAWARAEYLAGRLTTSKDNSSDIVSLVCPKCGTWINSGQTDPDGQLLAMRFFAALGQHMKGGKCEKRQREKLTRDDDMDSSHSESPISIRDQSLPPISPALSRRSSSVSLSPYLARRPSLSINTASPAPSFSIPSTPITPASGAHFRFSTPGSKQNELGDPCPGLAFDWNIDDKPFFQTFPVQRIGSEPDFLPFWYQGRGSQMELHFAISKKCTHFARSDPFRLRPCDLCEGLKPKIDRLRELANGADHNVGYQYLNWDQLHTRLDKKRDEITGLKFKMLNMGRSLASTARKLVNCRAFIMAVAENDVPRLNALVSTCVRSGAGVKTMTAKIAQAFAGNYSPKVFTPKDMELSLLVLRLGGRSLLHALNHALNLPLCCWLELNRVVKMGLSARDKQSARLE